MNIYALVLGQILRHFLSIAAAALFTYGVTVEMQNTLVETIITQIVPSILLAVSQGWSFLQKRYFPYLLETALDADPQLDTISTVKTRAAFRSSKPPVIY